MGSKNLILLGIGVCVLILVGGYILFSGDEEAKPLPLVPNVTPPAVNETPVLNETINVSVNETKQINETPVVNETINEAVNITIPVSNYTTEEEVELIHEMAAYNPNRTGLSKVSGGVVINAIYRLEYLKTKDPKYLEYLKNSGASTDDLTKEGANESNVMQSVSIEFKQKPPKLEELEVLRKMGVEMGFEMCAKHPTPSYGAEVPLDKIYEIVMLDFVEYIDSAESMGGYWLDDSVPAINEDRLHNLSLNGSEVRVAVILILVLYFLMFVIIKKFNIIKIQQNKIL